MRYNQENRKYMDEEHLIKLCREARKRARSKSEEDLFWALLVRVREDLKSDDPRGVILPFGNTRREQLISSNTSTTNTTGRSVSTFRAL